MPETITTKIRGTTAFNDDGRSRQHLIRRYAKKGEVLLLEREPNNKYDSNAIAVHAAPLDYIDQDDKIGYLSKEIAADLAPLMDKGYRVLCQVLNRTGGRDGKDYGVNIQLDVLTPEEVAELQRQNELAAAQRKAITPPTAPPVPTVQIKEVARPTRSDKMPMWQVTLIGTGVTILLCLLTIGLILQK